MILTWTNIFTISTYFKLSENDQFVVTGTFLVNTVLQGVVPTKNWDSRSQLGEGGVCKRSGKFQIFF